MESGSPASRHQHHDHTTKPIRPPTSLNALAWNATVHCFTGCAIGEVFGMVLATAFRWGSTATILVSVVLAFAFGYGFTLIPLLRNGMTFSSAASLALLADTSSIMVMELVDNTIMLIVPGAMVAGVTEPLFWGSLAVSLVVAFLAAYPVNRWLIARGRGHAVVHQHHTDH